MDFVELTIRKAEAKEAFWICWGLQDAYGWGYSEFGKALAKRTTEMTIEIVTSGLAEGLEVPNQEEIDMIQKIVMVNLMTDLEILDPENDPESAKVAVVLLGSPTKRYDAGTDFSE